MQKKYKRAIIITSVSLVVITLVLILAGLKQVKLDEYALNYNTIMANYSSSQLFGPGLYLIGLTNHFITVKKTQQSLSFDNLTTFTTDFYTVTAYLEVSYQFNFSTSDNFSTLSTFYENFGQDPISILEPIIKNEILLILASKSSIYYQNSTQATASLEVQIATQIQSVFSTWVGATINVIIESLVSEGTTTNTEVVDRQIQSLMHDIQRAVSQKIQFSDYYTALASKKQFEINAANTAMRARARNLDKVLSNLLSTGSSLTGYNLTKDIYDNLPLNYDMNMLNILEELVLIGNRTFPY